MKVIAARSGEAWPGTAWLGETKRGEAGRDLAWQGGAR